MAVGSSASYVAETALLVACSASLISKLKLIN
jgi:hypothetical protein